MNAILKKTRDKDNILLLQARDASYHMARKINWLIILLSTTPIMYSVISNLTGFRLSRYLGLDRIMDERILGFAFSILVFSITGLLAYKVNKLKGVSNDFREMYGCNVFGIPFNFYVLSKRTKAEVDYYAGKGSFNELYPVWY